MQWKEMPLSTTTPHFFPPKEKVVNAKKDKKRKIKWGLWPHPILKAPREALIKMHRGRCGKNGPQERQLRARIPMRAVSAKPTQPPALLSPQPLGLKPFVDFCGVTRSGETTEGIAQRSRLQKSANALQRPAWDLISGSLEA
jgi:hypothetical protein